MTRIIHLMSLLLVLAMPAFAQDMARSINGAVTSTEPSPLQVYVAVNGQQQGPYGEEAFKALFDTPQAAGAAIVWMNGMTNWAPASTVPQLQAVIAAIGQSTDPSSDTFQVGDVAAFFTDNWVTGEYLLTIGEIKYISVTQMTLLPDNLVMGVTVMQPLDDQTKPVELSYEAGGYKVTDQGDGTYKIARSLHYSVLVNSKVISSGEVDDGFVVTVLNKDTLKTDYGVEITRVTPGS